MKRPTKAKPDLVAVAAKKALPPPAVRLMNKHEVLAIVGCTYPTLWKMMRENKFPRSVVFGGRSVWRSDVIDAFLANLSTRRLKGDASVEQPSVV